MNAPSFTASQSRAAGVHPSLLHYYVKIGELERVAHGIYRNPKAKISTDFRWEDLVLTVHSIPTGVVCLTSALSIYDITEEIARFHWIAVPHSTSAPKRPLTKIVRMRDMETGKTNITLGKMSIPIFDRERTIVDAFRYLSRETAIKALKEALTPKQKGKINIHKLHAYARKLRVSIEPYILALTI